MGIEATSDEFVTSGRVTSQYLQVHHPRLKVYVSGTKSSKDEFAADSIQITNNPAEAEAVVIGFNTDLTFQIIEDICRIFFTADVSYWGYPSQAQRLLRHLAL